MWLQCTGDDTPFVVVLEIPEGGASASIALGMRAEVVEGVRPHAGMTSAFPVPWVCGRHQC